MNLFIDDTFETGDISRAFSAHYPFLKLEFYDTPHQWQEDSGLKHLLPDMPIGKIRTRHNSGEMTIRPADITGAVEQEFRKQFGLNVQIFRYHGNQWVQTAGTDELTLGEQNEIGKNASFNTQCGPLTNLEVGKRL